MSYVIMRAVFRRSMACVCLQRLVTSTSGHSRYRSALAAVMTGISHQPRVLTMRRWTSRSVCYSDN